MSPRQSATRQRTQREAFLSLEEAIEHFVRDLLGPHHAEKTATIRKVKAGFTRNQLTARSREFIVSAMLPLMRYTIRALVRQGRITMSQQSPLIRSLVNSKGSRALVERYLENKHRTQGGWS